jgi:hypothetical protein
MFVFTRKPLIVIESMPGSKTFNQLTCLFGQETFVVIRTNASKILEDRYFGYSGQKGKIFYSCSDNGRVIQKVRDYAGNLQFYDKSKAGRKIKNCRRKHL